MKDLSLHILDIVQNSIDAKATQISISIVEDTFKDTYTIVMTDNGVGMSNEELGQVVDPFYTTKIKKTGLGIPLLKQHTEMTGGNLSIQPGVKNGLVVCAQFGRSHIDRQPTGAIASTLTAIIRANPTLEISYQHKVDAKEFSLSTKTIKKELRGVSIASMEVINFLKELIEENLKEIEAQ
jgi:signal transduction histidine kinase